MRVQSSRSCTGMRCRSDPGHVRYVMRLRRCPDGHEGKLALLKLTTVIVPLDVGKKTHFPDEPCE